MDEPTVAFGHTGEPDPQRRMLLAGLAAACLSTLVPPAVAQPAATSPDAFIAVSRFLTGRSTLDATQAARLQEALVTDIPGFVSDVQALLSLVEQRKIDPGQLQHTLDAEQSALAALPRRIVTAWYTGVVGEGERARCITFETSLMHVSVADRLNPPSYCNGSYGTWAQQPL
jgi:hypothetical protein